MKRKSPKVAKKVSKKVDVKFSLKVPSEVAKEFQRASEKIKKRYARVISPELLMVWILTEVSEEYLLAEFEEALDAQSAAKK